LEYISGAPKFKKEWKMKSGTIGWNGTIGTLFLVVILLGCGGVEGDYACQGGLLDSLRLESGGKAYVSMTYLGQKTDKAGTYTVDGDKVTVVLEGQSAVFAHSGKTLDGGEMYGKCSAK
jgi:hypothetical protein